MKYIVAASLFAAVVSAQQIPNCALSCAISQVSASKPDFQADPKNCPTLPEGTNALTDTNVQKCLCKTTKFQTAFAECAKKAGCTDTEQCDLWGYSSTLCGGFGPDYALSDSLEPAQCKKSGGGGSSAAPPAETAAPPAGTSAPPAETSAPAASSGAGAAPPAETSAPAASSGAAAPPSYGSPSTVATSAAAGASGAAPSTTPTYVPSSGSTVVLSGAAAVFAGFVALLAL